MFHCFPHKCRGSHVGEAYFKHGECCFVILDIVIEWVMSMNRAITISIIVIFCPLFAHRMIKIQPKFEFMFAQHLMRRLK